MRERSIRRALVTLAAAALLSVPALAEPVDELSPEEGVAPDVLETPDVTFEQREQNYAVEYDYSGVVDASTGLPAAGGAPLDGTGRIALTDAMSYDTERGMYVYPAGGEEFYCTAADGMVTAQPVRFERAEAAVTLFRDGWEVAAEELEELTAQGEYVAVVGDSGRRAMSFAIVGSRTNLIYGYTVPEGFFIRSATWNGEPTDYERYSVRMEDEGEYAIEYRCPAADLTYTLETTIDRTAPELSVSGKAGDDGRFHSAVAFVARDAAALSVTRDGDPYSVSFRNGEGTLAEPGDYVITATDDAGNTAEYAFTILLYLDSNSALFILLVLAAVTAVAGLVIWKRRMFRAY